MAKITEKANKATLDVTDLFVLADSADLEGSEFKVKNIRADQLRLALGSDIFTGNRSVIIDSDAVEVPGKIYNTWSSADAYILTQNPTMSNQWNMLVYSEIDESNDILFRDFVHFKGMNNNAGIKDSGGGHSIVLHTNMPVDHDAMGYYNHGTMVDNMYINRPILNSTSDSTIRPVRFISSRMILENHRVDPFCKVYCEQCDMVSGDFLNNASVVGGTAGGTLICNGCNFYGGSYGGNKLADNDYTIIYNSTFEDRALYDTVLTFVGGHQDEGGLQFINCNFKFDGTNNNDKCVWLSGDGGFVFYESTLINVDFGTDNGTDRFIFMSMSTSILIVQGGNVEDRLGGDFNIHGAIVDINNNIEEVSTTSLTISLDHIGEHIRMTSDSPIIVTIPDNVSLPIGFICECEQAGNGIITYTAGGSVNILSKDSSVVSNGQYGSVSIKKVTGTNWLIVGDLG